jgi:predicted nucleotidyltransferase
MYLLNYPIRAMINFIIDMFRKHGVGCKVALGGSFPLRVYLPESDLDVVVLSPQRRGAKDSVQEIMEIFSCLCETIRESEKNSFPIDFEVMALFIFTRTVVYFANRNSRYKASNL